MSSPRQVAAADPGWQLTVPVPEEKYQFGIGGVLFGALVGIVIGSKFTFHKPVHRRR